MMKLPHRIFGQGLPSFQGRALILLARETPRGLILMERETRPQVFGFIVRPPSRVGCLRSTRRLRQSRRLPDLGCSTRVRFRPMCSPWRCNLHGKAPQGSKA